MSFADYGFAVWETFYVTVLATAFSLVIGLPLGVLLVLMVQVFQTVGTAWAARSDKRLRK